jgi:hypothetical protein
MKLLEQTLHYEICLWRRSFFAAKAGLLARVPSAAEQALPHLPKRSRDSALLSPAAEETKLPPGHPY